MNVRQELDRNRLPCGAMTVAIDGVCRRKLRDSFNTILDKLSELTSQEYEAPEAPEGHEIVDGKVISSEALKESKKPTPEEKAETMLNEGMLKNEVKAKLKVHEKEVMPEEPEEPEPTLEEKRKEMLKEAKMKVEVKVKAKEHEKLLMGNSKLLQDPSGKLPKKGKT